MLDYGVPLTILKYGDCTSYNGWIRENVGLERCRIREVSLYVHVYFTIGCILNTIQPILIREEVDHHLLPVSVAVISCSQIATGH